jgi:YbbR domain-containing protein
MKKTINNIKYFFSGIAKRIDKYVIVPITKVTVLIKKSLSKDSKRFEKILSSKSSLLIITLVISIGVFIAVDSKTITMLETSAEVLYNQPVQVQYNEEAYVLQGVPETVDITLIGRSYDLYLAKQISEHEVTLDLSGLKPGVHEVALKYKRALDTINYKLDPSVVTVTIYAKESEPRTVDVDLLNTDKLDSKLVIEKTEIDRDQVIVKGAGDVLKNVATVKALIDVNNFIDPKVGKLELRDIPLIAYDQSGNVMDVEIVPSKINATITITSPQKKVRINFVPTGTLSFGKAVSSITSNINSLTIYGDQTVLDSIDSIDASIDVNGLKEDKEYTLSLKRPVGIKYMSEAVANVKVTVGDEVSKEFDGRSIQIENLDSRYKAQASSASDQSVTVIVKGVQSVLDNLDPSTIKAYVDLKGYGIGTHEVDVMVERTDPRLTYISKVKTVTIVISQKR